MTSLTDRTWSTQSVAPVGKLALLQPVLIDMMCRSNNLKVQQSRRVFAEDLIFLLGR